MGVPLGSHVGDRVGIHPSSISGRRRAPGPLLGTKGTRSLKGLSSGDRRRGKQRLGTLQSGSPSAEGGSMGINRGAFRTEKAVSHCRERLRLASASQLHNRWELALATPPPPPATSGCGHRPWAGAERRGRKWRRPRGLIFLPGTVNSQKGSDAFAWQSKGKRHLKRIPLSFLVTERPPAARFQVSLCNRARAVTPFSS